LPARARQGPFKFIAAVHRRDFTQLHCYVCLLYVEAFWSIIDERSRSFYTLICIRDAASFLVIVFNEWQFFKIFALGIRSNLFNESSRGDFSAVLCQTAFPRALFPHYLFTRSIRR
jgi:hypothetical protein